MDWINESSIKLDRELSLLDEFVLQFVRCLDCKYVIVSGYVAILFGRSRGTEDVDIILEHMDYEQFKEIYESLLQEGFWPINSDDPKELFSMLSDKLAFRMAKKGTVIPNIELKFPNDMIAVHSLSNRLKVITIAGDLYISPLDLQVAYKRYILKSKKDLEDASHLQKIFNIDEENIKKYKNILHKHG